MNIQFLNHNDHIWRQDLQDDAYLEEGERDNKKPCHLRNLKGLSCWDQNISVKSEFFQSAIYTNACQWLLRKLRKMATVPHLSQLKAHTVVMGI